MSMPVIGASQPASFTAASSSAPSNLSTPQGQPSESYFDLPLSHTRTIKHSLTGTNDTGSAAPLLGLSKSPSGKHWAIQGRNLLKVVRFQDNHVQTVTDLREKTRLSKNYSLTCVRWGFESSVDKVVTGCSNGSVILWNVATEAAQRVERIKSEHDRAINHITFAGPSGSFVITGGQDGFVKFWDIRKKGPSEDLSLYTASDAVRQIALSPSSTALQHLCSVNESGALHKWDLRNASVSQDRIIAHVGGAMCIDWKNTEEPTEGEDDDGLIATGGLDGTVKIWSSRTSGVVPRPLRSLNTTFSAQNVCWRPAHARQLAVSPHNVASSVLSRASVSELENQNPGQNHWTNEIEIWDFERESIPLAVLRPSEGTVSDLAFADLEGESLVAVHRDSAVIGKYDLEAEWEKPLSNIATQHACWSINDELAFIVGAEEDENFGEQQSEQMLAIAEPDVCRASAEAFEHLARTYVYKRGRHTLYEACLYNAKCAAEVERYDLEATWLIIGACFNNATKAMPVDLSEDALEDELTGQSYNTYRYVSPASEIRKHRSVLVGSARRSPVIKSEGATPDGSVHSRSLSKSGLSTTSSARSASTGRNLGHVARRLEKHKPSNLSHIHSAPMTPSVDIDQDSTPMLSESDTETDSAGESNAKLRPRLKTLRGLSAATLRPGRSRTRRGPGLAIDRVLAEADGRIESLSESHWRDSSANSTNFRPQTDQEQLKPFLDMMARITAQIGTVLQDLANQGEALTCVYAMHMLKGSLDLDVTLQARCTLALIRQFRYAGLHVPAAAIAKEGDLDVVRKKQEDATTIYTACGQCNKAILQPPFTYCTRCQSQTSTCAICHRGGNVNSRSLFCATCGCSAHSTCIHESISGESECPSGCGHVGCPLSL